MVSSRVSNRARTGSQIGSQIGPQTDPKSDPRRIPNGPQTGSTGSQPGPKGVPQGSHRGPTGSRRRTRNFPKISRKFRGGAGRGRTGSRQTPKKPRKYPKIDENRRKNAYFRGNFRFFSEKLKIWANFRKSPGPRDHFFRKTGSLPFLAPPNF